MLKFLKDLLPERHPLRLLYHKIKAFMAALIYRFPANKLIVVGITGTNGKTTTVNYVMNILNEAKFKAGMSSTVNFQVGDERWVNATKQSTLGPFFLQKLLRRMVNEACKYAVLEVTSHSILQSRIFGINFDVGVFTNITADHLEYHGSFNNYLFTKGKLFKKVSTGKRKFGVPKVLILNKDDRYYSYFDQFIADNKITYGMESATLYPSEVLKEPKGSKFKLNIPNNAIDVELKMPGDFNIYNGLAAAAVGMALQVPLEAIQGGLRKSVTVPGRFEHIDEGQDFSVVVDYAHTPEALENLLELYKGLTTGKLISVFGCTGGGRDKAKRKVMGEIADRIADYIVLTDDDPYSEDEWEIIDQVAEGIQRSEGDNFWKIPDRKEAIRLALNMAEKDDCVVISGKGAEELIMVRGKAVPWNDKKVIEELLNSNAEIEL